MSGAKIVPSTLPFPQEALYYSGTILGTRGAGKSATARGLFQHELDMGHRCGFIDPMGDAAGIRLNPDGTPSRYQSVVIFGGPNGDLEISDQDGTKVARLVANHNISFIIDLSSMIEAEQFRFMTAFAETLFDEIKLPIFLLIDEAHLFAPQQTRDAPSKLLNRLIKLNTGGRKKGIYLWLMTQRPARINKNIISGAECLIAMRVGMPRDIETITEWLELHDAQHAGDVKANLARLKTGEAFVSIPLLEFFTRIKFDMHTTMDTGRTPQHGETVGGVKLPPIDLGDLAAAFGATSAGDPRDDEILMLKDQLSSLTVQLRVRGQRVTELERHARVAAARETEILDLVLDVQHRIGGKIGSMAIEPLPVGALYEDHIPIAGETHVRFVPRRGDPKPAIGAAKKRLRARKED